LCVLGMARLKRELVYERNEINKMFKHKYDISRINAKEILPLLLRAVDCQKNRPIQ